MSLILFKVISPRGVVTSDKVTYTQNQTFYDDPKDLTITALLTLGDIIPVLPIVLPPAPPPPNPFVAPGTGPPGPPGPQGPQGIPGVFPLTTITAYTSDTVLPVSTQSNINTNTGAVAEVKLTLPPISLGEEVRFAVKVGQYLRVVASGGVTVNFGATTSAVNGFGRSNTVGSMLKLVAISNTQWFSDSITGTWIVDT